MAKSSFGISDVQHKEWSIENFVLHIRMFLMQQNIASREKALEIMMKLEASIVGETRIGISQIQSKLVDLTTQFQDVKKGKEVHE